MALKAVKRKLIIDTDAGMDDAQAILMAIDCEDVEILAITTVQGNTNARQVGLNVLRVLQLANRLDIPVHVGADVTLLGQRIPPCGYHGNDGFGDNPDPNQPDESLLKSESAIEVTMRLTRQFPGEISLVCLAPLTNVACYLKMDPDFGKRLKHCHVMGGNYYGIGNTSPSAEWNFQCDPEAAHVVLNSLLCPITMVGWEVCFDNGIDMEIFREITSVKTRRNEFFLPLDRKGEEYVDNMKLKTFQLADEILMATVLSEDRVVKETRMMHVTVELWGQYTRGQCVVDWHGLNKTPTNVCLVTKINIAEIVQFLREIRHRD